MLPRLEKVFVVQVFAGNYHTGCLSKSGKTFLWGDNRLGQLFVNVSERVNEISLFGVSRGTSSHEIRSLFLYGDLTCVVGRDNVCYQSGSIWVQLHLASKTVGIKSVGISNEFTYIVNSFGQLYGFSHRNIRENRVHYKPVLIRENINKVCSGEVPVAIDNWGKMHYLNSLEIQPSNDLNQVDDIKSCGFHKFGLVNIRDSPFLASEGLHSLVTITEHRLVQMIVIYIQDIPNAGNLYHIADMLNCQILKQAVLEFIANNIVRFTQEIYITKYHIDTLISINPDALEFIQAMTDFTCKHYSPVSESLRQNKRKKNKYRKSNNLNPATGLLKCMPSPYQLSDAPSKTSRGRARANTQDVLSNPFSLTCINYTSRLHLKSFEEIQQEESKTPISLVKWKKEPESVTPFDCIQDEEVEDREVEEALLLIAQMESLQ